MTDTAKKQPDLNKIGNILANADEAKAKGRVLEDTVPDVDLDFEVLLDPLTDEQFVELEKSILEEGVREPILVWKEKNKVVDGHNRLTIALKHKLPFKKQYKSFTDEAAVKMWMIRNQLGRRNLTKDRMTYFLGVLYNSTKQDPKAQRQATEDGKTTSEVIGETYGVAEKTVRRAGEVAQGVDRLGQIKGKLAKANVLDGKSKLTQEDLSVIGKIKDDKIAEKVIDRRIQEAEAPAPKKTSSPRNQPTTPKPSGFQFSVVFMEPDFESLSGVMTPPPVAKEALVYVSVRDEYLGRMILLAKEWGLEYEGSFVFSGIKPYDGVFTKIGHHFMVIFAKGHMAGPKAGKEKASAITVTGEPQPMMIKIIEAYHADQKKLDMRPGAKASKDWSVIEK